MFNPTTPLESAIAAGDADQTLSLLRSETPEQRRSHRAGLLRMLKSLEEAGWKVATGTWTGDSIDQQELSLSIAIALCGTARDVMDARVDIDLLIELGREFHPRCLDELADAFLKASPNRIEAVQQLIGAGLVSRPDTDDYILGLIALPRVTRSTQGLKALFDADPWLRPLLLRVFEIEGTTECSLASSDQYNRVHGLDWVTLLLSMADDGLTTRAELLDLTLGALEKDWPQYRSGWFSRFHAVLDPDAATLRARLPRYLALCASRIPPTVALALQALKTMDLAAPIDADALLNALRPVMASSVKGQLEAAMKLLDRLVAREPERRLSASSLVAMALLHDSAAAQASVLERLRSWGVDEATRQQLSDFVATVAAVNRPQLLQLIGEAPTAVAADVDASGAHASRSAPCVASSPLPTMHPLDDARRLPHFEDLHELVECIAHVFENANDVDAFERCVAELVRITPLAEDDRPLFGPVRKRAARVKPLLPRELARLLIYVLDGVRTPGYANQDHGGNLSPVESLLNERIDALMDLAAQGRGLVPLSAPTHQGGYIAAEAFIDRVAQHGAANAVSTELEQVAGLLRLMPIVGHDEAPALRARARALVDAPLTRALRYALGDELTPDTHRELFAAAARIRHPREDDLVLDGCHPNLGPDGALMARPAWRVHPHLHRYGDKTTTYYDLQVDTPPVPAQTPSTRLAVRRHPPGPNARQHYRWWSFTGIDEGAVRYSATLLPSDPEAFFADGVRAVGNNLDWSEAQWQNRAYLDRLLDPVTAMTPMACLLLVLALFGKEPGQTAIAVDAWVAAHTEGRLSSAQPLVEPLTVLLASPLVKPARLHKSLQAALRIDARMQAPVFELLCAAVTVNPEDPPRDMALLLSLLLELKVDGARPLPPDVQSSLSQMKLSGQAKQLRAQLLA